MKVLLYIILGIIGLSLGIIFLPLVISGAIAWYNFSEGNVGVALLSIAIGIPSQWIFWKLLYGDDMPIGGGDYSCPYCDSGDTDGNHCYDCGEDS